MTCQIALLGLWCARLMQSLVVAGVEKRQAPGVLPRISWHCSELAPSCIGRAAGSAYLRSVSWQSGALLVCQPPRGSSLTLLLLQLQGQDWRSPGRRMCHPPAVVFWQGGQGQAGMEAVIQIPLRQLQDRKAESQNGQETNKT